MTFSSHTRFLIVQHYCSLVLNLLSSSLPVLLLVLVDQGYIVKSAAYLISGDAAATLFRDFLVVPTNETATIQKNTTNSQEAGGVVCAPSRSQFILYTCRIGPEHLPLAV